MKEKRSVSRRFFCHIPRTIRKINGTAQLLKIHKTHLPISKKSLPLQTDYVQLMNMTAIGPRFWPSKAVKQSTVTFY